MSGEQAAYATSGARAKLLLGASLAMVDVFLDVLVLHNFARDHQWKYFGIALGAIVLTVHSLADAARAAPACERAATLTPRRAPVRACPRALDRRRVHQSLATWAASNVDFGMVRGSTRDDWPNRLLPRWLKGARLFALVPGVNVVLHAVECLIVGERLRAFAYSRLLEATTEALPQALLQAFVALVDGSTAAGADAHSARLLYLSLGSSIATCAWALVEFEAESNVRFFVARTGAEEGEAAASKAEGGVRSPEERTERALPYRLVLFAARLGEVGARVLALALVGAATDGWALGALVVAEWVGLAAYVARGAHGGGGRRAALASAAAQGCVTSAFFLFARVAPLTPPAGVDGTCAPTLLPYRAYLPIRLLSLAASPIVVAVRCARACACGAAACTRTCDSASPVCSPLRNEVARRPLRTARARHGAVAGITARSTSAHASRAS